ncbi:uncharacterized protein LOC136075719 [Hydra vulgaris]|uniref:Uncharacterized protein LOC136075719 n=1 Tax=Hydra vulgaris TaxID=6087 RepID=A0ABM4B8M0_HYDVU
MKVKIYRTVVRPSMLYGLETVALTKRHVKEMEVSEMKMLRFSFGVTKKDRIRNEFVRISAYAACFGDKVIESRLRCVNMYRGDRQAILAARFFGMELPGKRRRGRPKIRFMDAVVEDMRVAGVSVEDTHDMARWRSLIRSGDP